MNILVQILRHISHANMASHCFIAENFNLPTKIMNSDPKTKMNEMNNLSNKIFACTYSTIEDYN